MKKIKLQKEKRKKKRREAIDTVSKSGKSEFNVLFKNKKAYDSSAI